MPGKRLEMRQIREILRLSLGCGLSGRRVGKSLGLSKSVVLGHVRRAEAAARLYWMPQRRSRWRSCRVSGFGVIVVGGIVAMVVIMVTMPIIVIMVITGSGGDASTMPSLADDHDVRRQAGWR